ncbi:hypothetical protein D3C78_1049140 [compost metagenome]
MLVAVGIEVTRRQGRIGLDIVTKLDHLDLQALFFGDQLHLLENLGVGAGGDADLDRCLVLCQGRQGRSQGQAQGQSGLQKMALVHGMPSLKNAESVHCTRKFHELLGIIN